VLKNTIQEDKNEIKMNNSKIKGLLNLAQKLMTPE
jgi:hypothetical protein